MMCMGLQGVPTVSREGTVGELVPSWGALRTPTSQTWPCSGPTRGFVCPSCRPFALNDLDDYEKHFTVMNYDPEVVLKQVGAWWDLQTQTPPPAACLLGRLCRQRSCLLAPALCQTVVCP